MNVIVDEFRRRYPQDNRSDDELTLALAEQDEQGFSKFEDFAADLQRIKTARALSKPTIPQEFTRGLSRGADSLAESAYGAGALAADVVGAESTRDALLKKYVESSERSATENASAVPRVEDVKDFESGLRFALGKIGELVPQIGEAVVTGAAGAAIGSAVAPGVGTAGGAAAGFAEGLVARQSAKALVRAGIDKILSKTTLTAIERNVVEDQIKKIAEKKAISGALHDGTKKLLEGQIRASAQNMGSLGANLLNFYGIGAGTIYGDLGSREGVDNADARKAALVGGIGSALANAPLPTVILSRYFPGVGHDVASSYIKRLASDAAKEIPLGATGETLDELVQIAAEKYADPKRRNTPLDDQDLSRLLNAAVVGGAAGGVAAPISAIPGPSKVFGPEISRYFKDLTDDRKRQLMALAVRREQNQMDAADVSALRTLDAQDSNFMAAFSSLSEPERNELVVELTRSKGGERNDKPQRQERQEGQEGQGQGRNVLTPKPEAQPAVETPPAAAPKTLSPEQRAELTKLGYDDNDAGALSYDEAVSIISTGLASPKKARRDRMRKAATTPIEDSAATGAKKVEIKRAAAETNPNPTPEQAEAGSYKKGKAIIDGLEVEIETPKGELRQNKAGGEPWSVVMPNHYGQILGTKDVTGEPIDITIGDNIESDRVWVIDQIDPKTKKYDEPKSFYGFNTPEDALKAYDSSFSDGSGPSRRGGVTEFTKDGFKKWAKSTDAQKPLRYKEPTTEPAPQNTASVPTAPAAAAPSAQPAAAASEQDAIKALEQFEIDEKSRLETIKKELESAKPDIKALESAVKKLGGTDNQFQELVKSAVGSESWNTTVYSIFRAGEKRSDIVTLGEIYRNIAREKKNLEKPSSEFLAKSYASSLADWQKKLEQHPLVSKKEAPSVASLVDEADKVITTLEAEEGMATDELDEKPTAEDIVSATPGQINRWKKGVKFGPQHTKAIAELMTDDDYKAIIKAREDADKKGNSLIAVANALPDAEKEKAIGYLQAGAPLSLKRQTLNEIALDYEALQKAKQTASTPESIGLSPQKGKNGKLGFYNIKADGVSGSVQIQGDVITLVNLRADKEGAGAGGAFIEKLKDLATATNRKLKLIAKADSKELSGRLEKFYRKHGFVLVDADAREFEFSKTAKEVVDTSLTPEVKPLSIDDIDIEDRATYGSSKRGKTKADSIVEPAWFRPTGLEAQAALEQRLLSDRGTPAKSGKQKTKRLTVLQDSQTGEVHIVSTYESSPGKVAVTIFNEDVRPSGRGQKKDNKSVALRSVLGVKLPDGKQRYSVIGSMRSKELTEFFHQKLASRDEFESKWGKPLDEKVAEVRRVAAAIEEQRNELAKEKELKKKTTAKKTVEKEGDIVAEHLTEDEIQTKDKDANPEDSGHVDVELPEPDEIKLSTNEANSIAAIPDFHSFKEYAELLRLGKVTWEQTQLIAAIKKKRDPKLLLRLMAHGAAQTLKDYDKANGGRTNYAAAAERLEQAAAQQAEAPVSDTGGGSGPGPNQPATDLAGGKDTSGQPESKGNEGDEKPDTAGGAVARNKEIEEARQRYIKLYGKEPDGDPRGIGPINLESDHSASWTEVGGIEEVSDPEQERRFNELVNTAARAGIDVSVFRNMAKTRGLYGVKDRSIHLAVGAAIGHLENHVAVHEIAHDVFVNLPDYAQKQLLDAIEKIPDAALGLWGTSYTTENPRGLSRDVLQHERLVEATTRALGQNGFSAIDSRSMADNLARAIKDAYMRAVIFVQQAFGFKTSERMAREYFANAVERLIAGDKSKYSYVDFAKIARPTVAERFHHWFGSGKVVGERYSSGGIHYDSAPATEHYASDLDTDNILNNVPVTGDVRATQTIRIEREVAALNQLASLQKNAAAAIEADPALVELLSKSGKSGISWLRKKLKLANPERARDALRGRRDVSGNLVEYNPAKLVDDFKDESNRDGVLSKSYRNTQSLAYKLDAKIRETQAKLEKIKEDSERVVQKLEAERKTYADLDAQAERLNKQVRRMVGEAIEVLDGNGKRSAIRAQLKVLDGMSKLSDYDAAIRAIETGTAMSGRNVVAALEIAANTPSIDFTKKADEIRQAMRESGKFKAITAGDKNANAMLATLIAIAKSNPRLLAELELRRLPEGRAEIEAKIDAMISGKSKIKPARQLTRENSIEDRVLAEYAKEARKIKDIQKHKEDYENDLKAFNAANPVVLKSLDELTGRIGATSDFVFQDGAEYYLAKAGMSTEDVLKSKDKLSLDSNNGPSDPKKLERQIVDMKEFLMEREERYAKGDLTAKDRAYQRVERQYQELAQNYNYKLDLNPSDRIGFELYAMPAFARIAESFGTASSQLIKKAGYHFARVESFLRNVSDGIYDKDYRIRRELTKLFPKMDDDALQSFIDASKITLEEETSDLVEIYSDQPEKLKRAAYQRVRDNIVSMKLAKDLDVASGIDRFMPAFQRLLELEHEAGNNFFLGQVLKGIEVINPITKQWEPAGLKVRDAKIKILGEDGEATIGLRRHFKKGFRTFGGRRMNTEFRQMVYAMRQSNWATFKEKIADGRLAEAYNQDPESAREMLREFFNHEQHGQVVQDWFLDLLARNPEPVFDAPVMEDGVTSVPADPALTAEALDASDPGDLVSFVENLHELHDGESDVGEYLQSVAERLSEYWDQIDGISDRYFTDDGKVNPVNAIRGMTPEALIDSREIEGLPRQWFSYYKFDKPNLHKLSRLIASEVSFGRGQEYLASLFDTVNKEVSDARLKLDGERLKVRGQHPTWGESQIEKEVSKMPDYKRLKKFEDRSSYVRQSVNELSSFFRKDNSPDATLWAGTRIAQTISRLMVNNPSSAIYQMASLFDPMFRYGVSGESIKQTLTGIKSHVEESLASIVQGLGIQIGRDDEFNNRFNALGLQYAERVKRFGDEFQRWDNESATAHGARLVEELTSTPINLTGSEARHVLFRPTGMFDWQTMVADRALTFGMWRMVGDYVTRGIEFYKNNPDKYESADYKVTNKDLKSDSFGSSGTLDQLRVDLSNFGIDLDAMIRGHVQRNDGKLFTDEEALRLNSLAMFLVSSQSNVATMTPAAWNNNILRWMIPLLGWAWRRTLDVSGKRLGPDGQKQATALSRGMIGLAAATVGGLAVSALVDKYYEELVNRKRNLRPIATPLGIIEHTARAGSTGFFGEFINGAVNVGTGGDNRIISLDRRVVAMSSFMGIQSALSNLINQKEFDYSKVGRPLLLSVGGNGMLQYLGMANNMFGLSNVEADVNARINAQNYLRVIGRDLDLSVRGSGGGGAGTPTAMTPYITRMELAAYSGNAYEFRNAYSEAIKKAKAEGFEDPVDHVKRAFSAKNPLRIVFQTPPREKEYQRILLALPEDGRQAVSSAVDTFNRYAESIGARGFEGKREAAKTKSRNPFGSMDRATAIRTALMPAL